MAQQIRITHAPPENGEAVEHTKACYVWENGQKKRTCITKPSQLN